MNNRELDCLIAKKVFGKEKNDLIKWIINEPVPHYSTDMNDAWLVVDWLINKKSFHFQLKLLVDKKEWIAGAGWVCAGETPQLAICKIALKVVDYDEYCKWFNDD